MAFLNLGEEFTNTASPDAELRRKLDYLAQIGSDAVLTPYTRAEADAGSTRKESGAQLADIVQLLDQQRARDHQFQQLGHRLDALDRASLEALQEARQRLEDIRRDANRASDGRRVFRDTGGTVYDEDDNVVSHEEIDWSVWDSQGPTRDQFRAARDAADEAAAYRQDVETLKERFANDPSGEDLDALSAELEALEAGVPESVARVYRPPGSDADSPAADAGTARTTSAAKLHDFDPGIDAAALGPSFAAAGAAGGPEAEEGPDAAPHPPTEFTPG